MSLPNDTNVKKQIHRNYHRNDNDNKINTITNSLKQFNSVHDNGSDNNREDGQGIKISINKS